MKNRKKLNDLTEAPASEEKLNRMIRRILAAFRIRLGERVIQSIGQFVKFGLVGLTNTLVSYLLNILTLKILEPYQWAYDYVAANAVAFILSVLWSFYWNNRFVFTIREGEKRNLFRTLLKTYAAYSLTGVVMTNILSYVWIDILGISKYIAPILNLVISVPVNFILNKKWAYRQTPGEPDARPKK